MLSRERIAFYRGLAAQGNVHAARIVDAWNPYQPRENDGKFGAGEGGASGAHLAMAAAHREAIQKGEGSRGLHEAAAKAHEEASEAKGTSAYARKSAAAAKATASAKSSVLGPIGAAQ